MEGYCEVNDESFVSIKFREFHEQLVSQEGLHLLKGKIFHKILSLVVSLYVTIYLFSAIL